MTGKPDDLMNKNLYEILGILQTATSKEIKTAYRKKALECHPDKNPDDPKAAELFHELTRILEILIDEPARAAYDKILNAKIAAKLRSDVLDSKRRKFKDELEEREKQAQEKNWKSDCDRFKTEIERLRKESSKQVETEMNYVRQQVHERKKELWEAMMRDLQDKSVYRLKVTWSLPKDDKEMFTYDRDKLNTIFSKYGSINEIVVSGKRKGSALIEFSSGKAALNASKLEKGHPDNPLTLAWIGAPPREDNQEPKFNSTASNISRKDVENQKAEDDDFEKMVLQKLKNAEMMKRQQNV